MHIFWDNVFKFFQFFISVLLGFFLTTTNSLFELLREPKQSLIAIVALGIFLIILISILKLMLGLN